MIKIYNMDVMSALKIMPDESVDLQIISPPYWSLRDYGDGTESIWGENKDCDHDFEIKERYLHRGSTQSTVQASVDEEGGIPTEWKVNDGFCSKCGAWKGQLGLEPNFDLYIKHLLDIFDQVKRVLKNDGTCWVNLGDTYYTKSGSGGIYGNLMEDEEEKYGVKDQRQNVLGNDLLPQKCLTCIPERFVLGMIERGWVLRNVIIWYKRNHMPTSVKDRFSNSHEFLFLFCKSNKKNYKNFLMPEYAKWLAGIIDGEGTISIHKRNKINSEEERKNPTYGLMLQVANTHKGLIDEIKRLTKAGSIVIRDERKNGYLKQWRWCAMGDEARDIIEQCYPYFIVKKEQASACLCLNDNRKNAEIIFQEVKKLNQREIDKTSFIYKIPSLKTNKYFFDLDSVREPHKSGIPAKFNIRVRDQKEGRTEQGKIAHGFATSEEVDNYDEKKQMREAYLIKKIYDIKNTIRDKGYAGKSQELSNWNEPLANAKSYRDGLKILQNQENLSEEELKFMKDYVANHLGDPKGKNPDDIIDVDDYWNITTKPFKESHFAVFPEDLVKRPIKTSRKTAVILDIFAGSGTTLKVARDLGRDAIGIEIKKDYCDIVFKRLFNGNMPLDKKDFDIVKF